MRLFEGEVLAACMVFSADEPSFRTHASNFSRCKRCAASPLITTVATPNCRKQSMRIVWEVSLRSTRATRAAAFLAGGIGARMELKLVSIVGAGPTLQAYSVLHFQRWQRVRSA